MCNTTMVTVLSASTALSCLYAGEGKSWKDSVPIPVFEKEPGYIELYWNAWETSYGRVKHLEGLPQSPYMDEAFWDTHIWIWDTAFMSFFTKYSPMHYPGVESLKNFYSPMHDGSNKLPLRIQHPDNPPLFAWCEYSNWKLNGRTSFGTGTDSVKKTLSYLVKHYNWFNSVKPGTKFGGAGTVLRCITFKDGKTKGFHWNEVASGMDNTVRGRGTDQHNPPLWVDAISQQGLSALYIARLAEVVGDKVTAKTFYGEYEHLKETVNALYWDEEDGTYYDIPRDSTIENKTFCKVLTPASFWPLLAEMATPEQAKRIAKLLKDPKKLGGPVPVVTLSRDDKDFHHLTGDYWRGAIWLPTTYMTVKALEVYGMTELADEVSDRTIDHMYKTYINPEAHKLFNGKPTIWECYSPSKPLPSTHRKKTVRPDFCGWSALGPISLFIENVLGFHHINAQEMEIEWRLYQTTKHGIKNLRFGDITTSIIYNGKDEVIVTSDSPYTLIINSVVRAIDKGRTTIKIETEPSPAGVM